MCPMCLCVKKNTLRKCIKKNVLGKEIYSMFYNEKKRQSNDHSNY